MNNDISNGVHPNPESPGGREVWATEHLQRDLKRRSVQGGALTMGSQALIMAIRTLATMALARLLTPADFGLVAMVAPITGFVALFKDLGLSMATVQWQKLDHDHVNALFWINVLTSFVLMAVTFALAPLVGMFYGDPRVIGITFVKGVMFLGGGFAAQHAALIRRRMEFARLAFLDVGSLVAGLLSGIAGAWFGMGYWALVLVAVVQTFLFLVMAWGMSSWRPSRHVNWHSAREMLRFGANLTGFNIVNYMARNLDNVLIGRVWGQNALGQYSKAYGLMLLPLNQVHQPLTRVAIPALSRLVDKPERYRNAYVKVINQIALVSMPLVAACMVSADWLVLVMLGPQWVEAGRIFSFLGFAALVEPVTSTVGWLFITQNRTREMFHWGLIGSGTTIAAIVAGLPYGAVGVAVAYSLTAVLIRTPVLFWFIARSGSVRARDLYGAIAFPSSLALIAALAVLGFRGTFTSVGPLTGLLATLALAIFTTGMLVLALPSGRARLADTMDLIRQFRPAGEKKSGDTKA